MSIDLAIENFDTAKETIENFDTGFNFGACHLALDSQGDWVVDVRMPAADWNSLEKRLENGISEDVVRH